MRPSAGVTLLISRKLARSVGIFYKSRDCVRLDTLISIYYALFYHFLTYGIVKIIKEIMRYTGGGGGGNQASPFLEAIFHSA